MYWFHVTLSVIQHLLQLCYQSTPVGKESFLVGFITG